MESFQPHNLGRKRLSSGVPFWTPSAGETAGLPPRGDCWRVYRPEALAGNTTQETKQEKGMMTYSLTFTKVLKKAKFKPTLGFIVIGISE